MASRLRPVPAPSDADPVWSPGSPIRVVLADDHVLMRRSLRGVLDAEEHVDVVGEADDLVSVEIEVRARQPHVLALDLGMCDGPTGIDVIGALGERVKIVGLAMRDDPAFAQRALMAGAVGFVPKELADAELGQAVRAAARGERFLSPGVAARLDARYRAGREQ